MRNHQPMIWWSSCWEPLEIWKPFFLVIQKIHLNRPLNYNAKFLTGDGNPPSEEIAASSSINNINEKSKKRISFENPPLDDKSSTINAKSSSSTEPQILTSSKLKQKRKIHIVVEPPYKRPSETLEPVQPNVLKLPAEQQQLVIMNKRILPPLVFNDSPKSDQKLEPMHDTKSVNESQSYQCKNEEAITPIPPSPPPPPPLTYPKELRPTLRSASKLPPQKVHGSRPPPDKATQKKKVHKWSDFEQENPNLGDTSISANMWMFDFFLVFW